MSTSFIDGTVEHVEPGRRRGAIAVFKTIRFQLADGSSRTITKAVTKQDVAAELVPGATGRFYLFNAFDIRGIHGVRTPDGRAICAFPTNNQKLFVLSGVIALAWVTLKVAVDGEIPLLGVALIILAVVGWYFMGKGQAEALRQFEGDSSYAPPAAAAAG